MQPDETSQHHVYTHPSPVEHWRHAVEIAALIIAAVWGFYVFVYQERIKPASELPTLDVQPSVSTQRLPGGHLLVKVSLDEKNISPVDLQLAATVINVYGFKYRGSMERAASINAVEGRYSYRNSLPQSRAVLLTSSEILYRPAGMKPAISNEFSPGREKKGGPVFAVSVRDFDAVKIILAVCFTRLDDKRVVAIKPQRTSDGAWDAVALAEALKKTFRCTYTPDESGVIFAL